MEALIDRRDRYIEFAALSRAEVAAVTAIRDEVSEKFPELASDTTARQFCGAMVAEVMRRNGHEVARARGRVSGGIFSYGTVFSPRPVLLSFHDRVKQLATISDRVIERLRSQPRSRWKQKPLGTGFSLVEHICHLRDLDDVYADRFHRTATLRLPELLSVDGTAWAQERNYQAQDPEQALAAFRISRQKLCTFLKSLAKRQRLKCGLRDGVRRMNIEDLTVELYEHDQTHLMELDQLAAEFEEGV